MNKHLRVLPLLLCPLFFGSLTAQIHWTGPVDQDLGVLQRREAYTATYRYRNDGPTPLILDNIRTECGCTAPEWSKAPVGPGEEGEILVTLRPGQRGKIRKRIKVYFKGIRQPTLLWVGGTAH